MVRLVRRTYVAAISVYNTTGLVRAINAMARRMTEQEAHRRAQKRLERLRRTDRFACLQPVYGLQQGGRVWYAEKQMDTASRRHEEFHAEAERLRRNNQWPNPLEESAANAWESTVRFRNPERVREAVQEIKQNNAMARQALRFAYALQLERPNGLLTNSVHRLRQLDRRGVGDPMAIAFSHTQDLLFYRECLAVLARWGPVDGKRILLEAVAVSYANGLNDGREVLLGHVTTEQRARLERRCGVNLEGFRFPTFVAPGAREEDWILD